MAITMPTNQIIDIRGSPRESNVGFAIYFLTILLIANVKDARRDLNGLWPADSNGKRGGQKKEERRELSGSGGSQHTCRILVWEPLQSRKLCCFCVASMDNMFQLIWELFRTGLLHAKVRQTWDFPSPRILWRKNSRWVKKINHNALRRPKSDIKWLLRLGWWVERVEAGEERIEARKILPSLATSCLSTTSKRSNV